MALNHTPVFEVRAGWRAIILGALLAAASAAAISLQPDQHLARDRDRINLKELAPDRFQDWVAVADSTIMPGSVPGKGDMADPYSDALTITYVNPDGERIMLAIAYGRNQLDYRLHAHRPEYCYRAQGFEVSGEIDEELATQFGRLPVRRLFTSLRSRKEPVTYWMTVSDQAVLPGWQRKLAQIRHGLKGSIPDGALVRVSSLDSDARNGYIKQDKFLRAWLASIPATLRPLLGIL